MSPRDGGALLRDARSGCGPISGRPTAATCKAACCWRRVLLFAAKLATLAVPFTFKWATDALAGQGSAPVARRILARLGARGADR